MPSKNSDVLPFEIEEALCQAVEHLLSPLMSDLADDFLRTPLLGIAVKKRRQSMGLTQGELADTLNLKILHLALLEQGIVIRTKLDEIATVLADYFSTDVRFLLHLVEIDQGRESISTSPTPACSANKHDNRHQYTQYRSDTQQSAEGSR